MNDSTLMVKNDRELAELVRQAQTGDQESLGKIFQLLSDRVFRFFRFRVSDTGTAEDLTQTVFLEMIRSLPRYKERREAKFTTWLFQIARFRLIDHYRRNHETVALEDAPEGHPSLTVGPPTPSDEALWVALRKLPERYQTILHLKFHQDCSSSDIAKVLGTTVINARVLQHRALRALRALLNNSQQ